MVNDLLPSSNVAALFLRSNVLTKDRQAKGGRRDGTRFSYGGSNMPKIQPARSTVHINRHQAENICHAFDFAKHIGRPLNTYVVINLHEASANAAASVIFERIRHKYRDWLKGRVKRLALDAQPPVYVYAHENPDENPHGNWVVHVPPRLQKEFLLKLRQWVEKAQGGVRPFDIQVKGVDPHTDKTLAKYIIKGTDPHYVPYLHLQDFAQPQGRVFGRRATPSIAIGRAARKSAGFIPRLHRHLWKRQAA